MGLNGIAIRLWPRQQESNLYFTLRRHTFYPLNYGESEVVVGNGGWVLPWYLNKVGANKRPVSSILRVNTCIGFTGRLD